MKFFYSVFVLMLVFVPLARGEQTIDLDSIVVEASRSNDTAGGMNKDVSIITSQDIAHSPAKSLPELLNTVPGIYSNQYSNIQHQQVDIGGFGEESASNVLVLVDGRRLNAIDLSGADLSQIDLNSVDHIEIIQGSASVLYGNNAVGGIVNIITKKGSKNTKPSVSLSSQWGSYKSNQQSLEVNGGFSKWDYQFNYSHKDSDGYRSHSNYWANDYNTRLGYDPNDSFGVDFVQGYHLDRYRLPGGLSISQIDKLGPTGVLGYNETYYGYTSDSHFDVTPHLKFDLGSSRGEFSLLTSARKRESNIFFTGVQSNYGTNSYEFQPKLIISTPLTDRLDNKLTSGFDYFYNKNRRQSGDITTPQDLIFASEVTKGVYLLDELTLDEHWLLNTGVRGSWAKYMFNQKQVLQSKFERSATTQGYEGGLGYKYNPNSKVYVNYSHSYRLPGIDEFFQENFYVTPVVWTTNPGLTYQVGNEYQLGIKDQSFKDIKLGFNVTAAQYKNEIYDDPLAGNLNYGKRTRHYSEQAGVSTLLFNKKIEPFASVTFQQACFYGGEFSRNQIPFVPDQLAHTGVTYRPLERLSTTLSTDFVGKRFSIGDEANTQPKLKRYETMDWSANYGFRNIEIWVSLRNLFNSRYITLGSFGQYYPAPGRNAQVGVKVRF